MMLAACGGTTTTGPQPDAAASEFTPPAGLTSYDSVVTFASTPFVLMPGQEVFKCQDFANPFGGVDTDLQAFQSVMTPGSHHMLLFYQDGAGDVPLNDCPALQFQTLPYAAQSPENAIVYPDGIGGRMPGTQGFHMQMHYLNSSMAPMTVQVKIALYKAVPQAVKQHAGVFFLNNVSGIHVPAKSVQTVTASYTFKQPVKFIYGTAHMHKYDNNLVATMGGKTLFQTESWDAPPFTKYLPELDVPAGSTVTWSCEVNNTTATKLTFGESALTNDMCIFTGQYYPVLDDADPTILSVQ